MQVVKASSGHFPQPFLISDVKRTGAKIMREFNIPNFPLLQKIVCWMIHNEKGPTI
jgi:hypothetical protein